MSQLRHRWRRESGRRARCVECGLLATSKISRVDRRPYTQWFWQGNEWDSRSATTPACPPGSA